MSMLKGIVGVGVVTLFSASAFAQAWVGERNSASMSLSFSYTDAPNHVRPDRYPLIVNGKKQLIPAEPDALVKRQTYQLAVSYNPLDRLELKASLPYVITEYGGKAPHKDATTKAVVEVDDGKSHGYLTDFALEMRYMLPMDINGAEFALAPFLGVGIPVTDYPTLGHGTPGRGFKEARFGLNLGYVFAAQAYANVRYQYTVAERHNVYPRIDTNRSHLDAEIGYFVLDDLSLRLASATQFSHGGFQNGKKRGKATDDYHDQLTKANWSDVGAGVNYNLLDAITLSANYSRILWAQSSYDGWTGNFSVSYSL